MDLTYEFEAYMRPHDNVPVGEDPLGRDRFADGILLFTKDGYIPVQLEVDIQTPDGVDWTLEKVRIVEHTPFRSNAASDVLNGVLLESAVDYITEHMAGAISSFVAASYEEPEDERLTEAWKDAAE